MKKETIIEIIFLLIFSGIMLWIGLADSWGHKIEHDFAYSYLASDTFQHQTRAQWIKDAGNYKYEAPYYSAGLTKIVGFYPPIFLHLTVLFSHSSGLEVYDVILFLTVFFAIIGAIIFYFILANWNKQIAILSMPLMTQIFTIREARIAFYWGHWPALIGDFFLVASCWMLVNLDKKKSGIILGILLAGTALGHTAATVLTIIFIILFFAISLFYKKFTKEQLKQVIFAFAIFFIASIYFLIMFKQTWMAVHKLQLNIVTDWVAGGGFVKLADFGNSIIIMALGLIFLLLLKQKEKFFQMLLGIFSIFAGLTNYVGFSLRAFNFRFYWPILLSIFFGTGIYKLTKLIIKNLTTLKSAIISMAIIALLLNYNYHPTGQIEGIMNPYTWQTINWIKDNTKEDAKIFFFYGDPYDQDASLGNTKRRSTRVEITDLGKSIQNKIIERNYPTKELIESGTQLPYKKTMFSYGLVGFEDKNVTGRKIRDLCNFDYYVFDKAGRAQILVQLNQIIASTFAKENFTVEFDNPLSVILKNPNPGGNCLGAKNTIQL